MPGRPACLVVGSEHRSLPNRGQQAALGEINGKAGKPDLQTLTQHLQHPWHIVVAWAEIRRYRPVRLFYKFMIEGVQGAVSPAA